MSNTSESSPAPVSTHATRHQPGHMGRGHSTAVASNVEYRLGKLEKYNLYSGDWLDCGCGDGGYSIPIRERGAERVVGIDVECDRIELAKQKAANISNMEFHCVTSEQLPFDDRSFDVVFLNEVFEHVADEQKTMSELYRVLKPGGSLVLMSPNRWFPFEGHGITIGRLHVGSPVPLMPWLPIRLVAPYMNGRNYWPFELKRFATDEGFQIVDVTTVFPVFEVYPWLPSFVIRWYRTNITVIDQLPVIKKFGLSTLLVARRPMTADNGST